jgi:hypothetical protein
MERKVSTGAELHDATQQSDVRRISVTADLHEIRSLRLAPGQSLVAANAGITLEFASGDDGVELSTDNEIDGLELRTSPDRRAVFNDTGVESMGRLVLKNLRVTGLVQLLASDAVRSGHVEVENLDITGRLTVRRLETGAVYSDGGIAPGTPDRITGGVFVVSGAFVDRVRNTGPVMSYGANDMVLDNWGSVSEWIAEEKVTSYGPSGIGFVNFGTLDVLRVHAPLETFGLGARGFNVYAGTVRSAEFDRIVTHADGAVGIQISRPVGEIVVRRGIETHGATGQSLVKGVVMSLSAIGLSIKSGGSARRIAIDGGLITHGEGINPFELHGAVERLEISAGISSLGGGFETL